MCTLNNNGTEKQINFLKKSLPSPKEKQKGLTQYIQITFDRTSTEKNKLQGMAFYSYCNYYLYVVPVTCSQIANFSSEHDVNSQVCPLQYQHCNNREYGLPTMNKNRFGSTFLYYIHYLMFEFGCFKPSNMLCFILQYNL